MADAVDSEWLRRNWSIEQLGKLDGWWIAVRHEEIVDQSAELESLLARFQRDIEAGTGPIFAHVHFGIIQ